MLKAAAAEPVPLSTFIVKVASRCNLACTYCYEYSMGDESWRGMPKRMAPATVRRLAERIQEHAERFQLKSVVIVLHGGEPLLFGKAAMRAFVQTMRQVLSGFEWRIGIQSNGTLIDEKWIDLFVELDFKVSLSVDGPEWIHDRHRIDHRGRGTFARVREALRLLTSSKGAKVFSGCLVVVDPSTPLLEVYEGLLELGVKSVDLLPQLGTWDVLPAAKRPNAWAGTPLADWLIPIFDRWLTRDSGHIRLRLFESIIEQLAGAPSKLESLGAGLVRLIIVAASGELESADALKVIPGQQAIGMNIFDHSFEQVMRHPMVAFRQSGLNQLSSECRACPSKEICGGGYLPDRWSSDRGFDNPSIYCADLFKVIHHVQERVEEMLA
jgi:uncharacterized protein